MSDDLILGRKDQHLDVVLSGGGRHVLASGFDDWRFVHEALPDLDHAKIDLGVDFLGRRLQTPTEKVGAQIDLGVVQIRQGLVHEAPVVEAAGQGVAPAAGQHHVQMLILAPKDEVVAHLGPQG